MPRADLVALQDEHLPPRLDQMVSDGAPDDPGADDDHVGSELGGGLTGERSHVSASNDDVTSLED